MSKEKLNELIAIACDGDRSSGERRAASDALAAAGFDWRSC